MLPQLKEMMMKTDQKSVSVLMGSETDLSTMESCLKLLKELQIPFEAHILSAHRTPIETAEYVRAAEKNGCAVFIAAAGLAAHLAGAVAANTTRPVIGVPMGSGELQGLDALLATVQMPGGTPVACVAIGSAGAKNAAVLAAQILALQDQELASRLVTMREDKKASLKKADATLQNYLLENV
jgi:5-(carboxyamino)imidazole ribonucleotide mutase